jgi:hypothetical protein
LCSNLKPMVRDVAVAVAELDEAVQTYCNKSVTRVSLKYPFILLLVSAIDFEIRRPWTFQRIAKSEPFNGFSIDSARPSKMC